MLFAEIIISHCTIYCSQSGGKIKIIATTGILSPRVAIFCIFGLPCLRDKKERTKPRHSIIVSSSYGCGGRTRTYDLRVMSPTSFQLLYSAIFGALPECLGIISQGISFVKVFFLYYRVKSTAAVSRRGAGFRELRSAVFVGNLLLTSPLRTNIIFVPTALIWEPRFP